MRTIVRLLATQVEAAARAFPAVVVTGPRRAGKTSLLRRTVPSADYVLLEDPDVLARVRNDPRGFLDERRTPVILDEIQNAPELLSYVRTRIDRAPRKNGQWFLTGSQELVLMYGVSESLAGRAAILQLLPLSQQETARVTPWHGGFPEVLARPTARALWYASYLQTYIERDVRAITRVKDLVTYRRFLAVLATRHGQVLNKSDLAAPLGVSVPTIGEWLHVLEATGHLLIVPPYHSNLGKRLLKSPKVYISDSGLACYLLGIESTRELERSPFLGAIIEGFAASEIVKAQLNRGQRKELYYFRDRTGLEVDFVLPVGSTTHLVEVKASRTVRPHDALGLERLRTAFGERDVAATVVHRTATQPVGTTTLAPGVRAIPLEDFIAALGSKPRSPARI